MKSRSEHKFSTFSNNIYVENQSKSAHAEYAGDVSDRNLFVQGADTIKENFELLPPTTNGSTSKSFKSSISPSLLRSTSTKPLLEYSTKLPNRKSDDLDDNKSGDEFNGLLDEIFSVPGILLTSTPSSTPTCTSMPSLTPSTLPTKSLNPSVEPSPLPSSMSSLRPSSQPSLHPFSFPSNSPTITSTFSPSASWGPQNLTVVNEMSSKSNNNITPVRKKDLKTVLVPSILVLLLFSVCVVIVLRQFQKPKDDYDEDDNSINEESHVVTDEDSDFTNEFGEKVGFEKVDADEMTGGYINVHKSRRVSSGRTFYV